MAENNNWYTHFSTFEEDRGFSVPIISQGRDPRFNEPPVSVYSRDILLCRMNPTPSFHICDWGEDRWPAGRAVNNRNCDDMPCLHFMVDGEGHLNGSPLKKNMAFVTDPAIPYSMVTDGANPFHYFWVRVRTDLDFFRNLDLFTFGEDGVGRFDFSDCREDVMRLFRKGFSVSGDNGWGMMFGINSLFFEILSRCLRHAPSERTVSPYVKDALEYIRTNYKSEINVNLLAEQLHISRNHLRRLFLRDLGVTPKDQITRVRMDVAATILESGSVGSLAQVAQAVGYPSYSQFLQAFRKEFGCNPKEYRKQY
ncbi:MAG: helix-turn-helix domain-containing protein [Clostridia bacterium]|nr:helix-turn-helix domain-containing protein [Clostridia bacterium]